eukprot:2279939-Prymnesium_polylepis.2
MHTRYSLKSRYSLRQARVAGYTLGEVVWGGMNTLVDAMLAGFSSEKAVESGFALDAVADAAERAERLHQVARVIQNVARRRWSFVSL